MGKNSLVVMVKHLQLGDSDILLHCAKNFIFIAYQGYYNQFQKFEDLKF